MIVLLTGMPSLAKSATARLLAERTGFTYFPLHPEVSKAADAETGPDEAQRRRAVEALKRRTGRSRHFVCEDFAPHEDLRKHCESAGLRLFVVRIRSHDVEVRRGTVQVARGERPPLYLATYRRLYDERLHRRGGEVDLEIQASGKDPSEAVWWILSSGQIISAVGDEGIQITVSDVPAEDQVLRENLARNAGSQLLYECLYCSQFYLRDHMLRLDPVRYLVDGVLCVPWSCHWCWGTESHGLSQDDALTLAEEAEILFSDGVQALGAGEAASAVRLFLRASEFATSYDGLYANLAAAFELAGEPSKALAEVAKAVKLNPSNVLHRFAQACLLEEAGLATDALREWRAVAKLGRRAQLAPPDFVRRDLTPILERANAALALQLPAAALALENDTEAYSECERAVLRAETHYTRDEYQAALTCLENARELYVKESPTPQSPQLFQRINRLVGDCHHKLSGGGTATRDARPPRDAGGGDAPRPPRKSGKSRRQPPRPADA